MNKLRVSLVEKAGVIRGTIETDSDALFVLECLAVIVGEIAMKSGVPELEVAADLHGLIARRQRTEAGGEDGKLSSNLRRSAQPDQ